MDKNLRDIYYNSEHPASYGSLDRLFKATQGLGYKKREIKKWLEKQEVYTLHKQINTNFKRPRVVVPRQEYQWDADTIHMVRYNTGNEGYSYILVIVDIFTRYAWTAPLKTLRGKEMMEVLSSVFQESKPVNLRTDSGSEFKNKLVSEYLKSVNVHHFTTTHELKANFAERFVKTLKTKLTRYMYYHQTDNWTKILKNVTKSYNSATHRSIAMSPIQARSTDSVTLWNQQYANKKKVIRGKQKPRDKKVFKLELNDKVRLVSYRTAFQKAYEENWTKELYIVTRRMVQQNIPLYNIKSYSNEPIIGKFYENELERVNVDDSTTYKVEKFIRKKTMNKKKGYIVKWVGWGNEFNSWVSQKDVEDIKKSE